MSKRLGATKPARKMEIIEPAASVLRFFARPPLLSTESRQDFEALLKDFQREIRPKGVIEEMYVADIAAIIWEILRLRRCKTATINSACLDALKAVLAAVSEKPPTSTAGFTAKLIPFEDISPRALTDEEQKRENLPFDWFHDKRAKEEVARKLAKFGLDESAIEARAIRSVSGDLELLDEMLISLENRRDKFLRQLEYYRESFARRMRASADRIIDAEFDAPSLQPGVNKISAA
jgi:hypothetical protein